MRIDSAPQWTFSHRTVFVGQWTKCSQEGQYEEEATNNHCRLEKYSFVIFLYYGILSEKGSWYNTCYCKINSITRVLKRHWYPKGLFCFFKWGVLTNKSCENTVNQPEVKNISFGWNWNLQILKAVCSHSVDKEFKCVYYKWITATLLLDWNRFDFENNTKLAGKQWNIWGWMKRLCCFFPPTITSWECSSHFVALKP